MENNEKGNIVSMADYIGNEELNPSLSSDDKLPENKRKSLTPEQCRLKRKKVGIILLSIALVFAFVVTSTAFTWFGWVSRVLKDTFAVGVDYIDLEHPLEKISKRDMNSYIAAANKNVSHPFVLVTADDFDSVRAEYESENGNAYVKDRMTYAIGEADKFVQTSLLTYELDKDGELLPVSRQAVNRIMTLAGAWRITSCEKYAERAWREIENVCNFPDWHDEHFLDTAEMSFAVSLGYDWLYDYLSPEQRDFVAGKTYEFSIGRSKPSSVLSNWWLWSKVNWNTQCYGGVGVTCMVFSDYYPKEASDFLRAAYYNMPLHFESFSPDGAYVEGNSYWEAMSSYLIYFVSTSRNYFGGDFGLSGLDGFDKIGYFPLYISAPCGVFNFGDNRNEPLFAPSLHWFSSEYDEPMLSYFQQMSVKENEYARESVLNCLWFDAEADFSEAALSSVSKSVYMRSDVGEEFVTMRSGYCDENATYIGMKGGYNYTNHGDLDIGSFVFDALGERWICDLGKASYSSPGYFVGLVGGGRWKVYAKRAEGHNTLVVNPDKANEDQYPFATVRFSDFMKTDGGGVASLDMTDAYIRNGVRSVVRVLDVYDDYGYAKITDTVECKKKSDVWWFAHTDATVELRDGGKTAVLSKTAIVDGVETVKRVFVKIGGATDGVFEIMDAVPLSDKKRFADNKPVDGIKKLAIRLSGVTSCKIEVTFEPDYGTAE